MFSTGNYEYEGMLHTPEQRQDAIRKKALELIRTSLTETQLNRILELYDQVKRKQTFSSLGNRDQRLKKVKLRFQEQEAQQQRQLWKKLFQELEDRSTTSLQKLEKILKFMNTHGNTKNENGITSNTMIDKKSRVPFLRSLLEFNVIVPLSDEEKKSSTTFTTPLIDLSSYLKKLDTKIESILDTFIKDEYQSSPIRMKMFYDHSKGETISQELLLQLTRQTRQAKQAKQSTRVNKTRIP